MHADSRGVLVDVFESYTVTCAAFSSCMHSLSISAPQTRLLLLIDAQDSKVDEARSMHQFAGHTNDVVARRATRWAGGHRPRGRRNESHVSWHPVHSKQTSPWLTTARMAILLNRVSGFVEMLSTYRRAVIDSSCA